MKYPATKQWSKDRHPIFSLLVLLLPAIAQPILALLSDDANEPSFELSDLPDIDQWLSYYKEETQTKCAIVNFLKLFEGFPKKIGSLLSGGISSQKLIEDSSASISQIVNSAFNLPEGEYPSNLFDKPEIQFAYFILIPSLFYAGVDPFQLFRKAQSGNKDAIITMLRLDPSVLSDPKIFRHFHHASKSTNKSDFLSMTSAISRPLRKKMNLQKMKYRLAGLILGFSELFNCKLTSPEIEKLFNAIAIDFNTPDLKLVDSDDVFEFSIAKRIHREKVFWVEFFNMDKK